MTFTSYVWQGEECGNENEKPDEEMKKINQEPDLQITKASNNLYLLLPIERLRKSRLHRQWRVSVL